MGDLGVDENIILKLVLIKTDVKVLTRFMWLRGGTRSGSL
jgi:hypothetical protein